jgi:hypothetical protein
VDVGHSLGHDGDLHSSDHSIRSAMSHHMDHIEVQGNEDLNDHVPLDMVDRKDDQKEYP